MTDDRAIALLTEMRDLMRKQVENSNTALERQAEAVKRQVEATKRAKRSQVILGWLVILLIFLSLIPAISALLRWITR